MSKVLKVVGTVFVACLFVVCGWALAIWYDGPQPRLNDQVSAGDITTLIVGLGQIGAALFVAWRVQRLLATEQHNHQQRMALDEQKFQRQHSLSERRKRRIEELFWQIRELLDQTFSTSELIVPNKHEQDLMLKKNSEVYWRVKRTFELLMKLVETENSHNRRERLRIQLNAIKTSFVLTFPYDKTLHIREHLSQGHADRAEAERQYHELVKLLGELYECHDNAVTALESLFGTVYELDET